MGLFSFIFGKDNSEDDDEERDDHGKFSSVFGSPGDTSEDDDLDRGNYKEKDWYD